MAVARQAVALVRLEPLCMLNNAFRGQDLKKIMNKRLADRGLERLIKPGKRQFAGLPLQGL